MWKISRITQSARIKEKHYVMSFSVVTIADISDDGFIF